MSLLRNFNSQSPAPCPIGATFYDSKVVDVISEVKDTLGNVVAERPSREVVRRSIPDEEFVHQESAELYSIENMLATGMPMERVTTPYFKQSLDDATFVFNYLNQDGLIETQHVEPAPSIEPPEPPSSAQE